MSSTAIAAGDKGSGRGNRGQVASATPTLAVSTMTPGKRVLDLALAVPALFVAAPVMLVAAILIRLTSRGPALYRQTRIGRGEQPFTMLKLRTMRIDGDDAAQRAFNTREILGDADPGTSDGVFKLEQDPRITPVGRLLRRFSIDELPQLLNVISGEMSLVGPRPSLPWEVELYTPEQRRRHECMPGITGLWQVSGRSDLAWEETVRLDLYYVDHWSPVMDIAIILRTFSAVARGSGAY
jgi:lipopolysaccharide/colanic/teichoic acid biosynthesis glycosyltransferase